MSVHRYLDITTAAISKEEADRLADGSLDWIHEPHREYGWWVWVPSDPDLSENELDESLNPDGETPAPNLAALIRYARSQGCNWLLLDCDGDDPPAGFPTFDW